MNNKFKKPLSENDLRSLDATSTVNWTPKEPRELLLPYVSEEKSTEESDLDKRKRKAKEVYDGYNNLIQKSAALKQEIEDTCSAVETPLNPSNQLDVIAAVQRTFGTDGQKITFEMYKKALDKLYELANNNIARP